jgi:homoserine kinase
MTKSICVSSPGSVANMVCGFDVLGFALNDPADRIELSLLDRPDIVIEPDPDFQLPTDPAQNVAGAALQALMQELKNEPIGFRIAIKKNIKPGSGIGSSAASAAGVVVAANHLLGQRFTRQQLVQFAMFGEKLASGVKHADNIAPCIYGGITLVRSIFPLDIISLPTPSLFVSIVHPQIEVRTADARAILKQKVLLKDAIRQWGNIAGLVAGIIKNDPALIGRSMEDHLIEPVRSMLIPGYAQLKKRCMQAGALGGGISGSGPSVFMLSQHEETAFSVETAMKDVFDQLGIAHATYVTTMNTEGVKINTPTP